MQNSRYFAEKHIETLSFAGGNAMRYLRNAWAIILLLALAAAGGACAGSDQMSLEEYFARVQALDDASAERSEPLEAEFEELFAAGVSLEERAKGSQLFFTEALDQIEGYQSDLRALDPPQEVAALHAEIIGGLAGVIEEIEAAIKLLDEVRSEEELAAVFFGYVSAFIPLEAPCLALEDLASDRGIETDMDCEV